MQFFYEEQERVHKYLYHGTGQKYEESIDKIGLILKSCLYVHLSGDKDTAVDGKRKTC